MGLLIFFRKIIFTNKSILKEKGPLLLACNHPNSFLDALILGAHFKHPVHFLARGDAFKNPIAKKLLTALKAIPIYRLREGKEYLALNDNTFDRCLHILKQGGIVLNFAEGLCVNQWQLRPLKKGTARIALNAWKLPEIKDDFIVLPASFNYSSFSRFRKKVIINFAQPVLREEIASDKNEGEQIVSLNKVLYTRLENGMLVEKSNDSVIGFLINNVKKFEGRKHQIIQTLRKLQDRFLGSDADRIFTSIKGTKKISFDRTDLIVDIVTVIVLLIPALIGFILHLPLYLPLNNFIKKKTKGTVFYHSALFGSLIIVYPIYLLIISITIACIDTKSVELLLIVLMPLLALVYLHCKDCMESLSNYFLLKKKERIQLKQLLS